MFVNRVIKLTCIYTCKHVSHVPCTCDLLIPGAKLGRSCDQNCRVIAFSSHALLASKPQELVNNTVPSHMHSPFSVTKIGCALI